MRTKLTVTEIGETKPIGKATKHTFKANDGTNTFQYFTFSEKIAGSIIVDAEIDVDIEVSSREWQGNTYTDRKVTQIYIDGEAVVKKWEGGGGSGGGSFAQFMITRKSIERQNALTNAVSFWSAIIAKSTSAIDPASVEDKLLKTADKFYEHTSTKEKPEQKEDIKDDPLFDEKPTEHYSFKTQADYEASVKTIAGKLGFTTVKHLSEFIANNSKMLPNTAWKSYDDGLKGIFIALLQKEAENKGV
jgi:Rieske Fe-S protein